MVRCEAHGLAVAPDGLCTLCRRRAQGDVSRRLGRVIAVTMAVVLALAVVAVVTRTILAAREAAAQATIEDPNAASTAQIKVYTTKWCPACRATRGWLKEHEIAYVDRDVESDPVAAAEFRKLGSRTVPTFDIDGQVKAGFDPMWVTRAIEKSEARRAER